MNIIADIQHQALKAMVMNVLTNALDRKWTIQGFGMLRTYIDDEWRLHVWDKRYRVENVSMMHDHPWHFESCVVAGELINRRFDVIDAGAHEPSHYMRTIKPGTGLQFAGEPEPVIVKLAATDALTEGQWYSQRANEIHISAPADGTVTLVKRTRSGPDLARVLWPSDTEWVSAEPRPAVNDEIMQMTEFSLYKWFS